MEPTGGKPGYLRNTMVRVLLLAVLLIAIRFAYVVTIAGESCNSGDFCFFSLPENLNFVTASASVGAGASANIVKEARISSDKGRIAQGYYTSKDSLEAVEFYTSIFINLTAEGYLSPNSNALCINTPTGHDVFALKEIGVSNSIGVSKKARKPLVIKGEAHQIPFDDNTFDFVFSVGGHLENYSRPLDFALEIGRTLKPKGIAVVHVRAKDKYSFNSFIDLFNCCKLIKSRDLPGFDQFMPSIREYILRKEIKDFEPGLQLPQGNWENKCLVPGYKHELVTKAEPLILEEPLKPWITLKRNINKIKYLPSMVDISFKNRYVYVDVGARSYGSSIGSWFKKQYPKQNKTFEVYAIEADKTFHEEYKSKKKVKLLPYAAWIRNETLFFEINQDPGESDKVKSRGMGRIQRKQSSSGIGGEVDEIEGFDFALWLKNSVSDRDFVVMKMDVEGTEFDLIPRLFETGAICLIDEIFLECHYNRWQRCCPGQRSTKYDKTYDQCLELFTSLRQSGILVHQWW